MPNNNSRSQFPDTRDSIVAALSSREAETYHRAYDLVVRAYRAPVVSLLRRRWNLNASDAEDFAQEFFARAMHREWLSRYEADKGRFRTFFRACLHAFVATELEAFSRQKRGGNYTHVALSEAEQVADAGSVDDQFEREWVRSVLSIALEALKDECTRRKREVHLAMFWKYDIQAADTGESITYAQLAEDFDAPVTQVTNYLAWARRRYRAHVHDTLRSLAGSDAEYRTDVRELLGVDAQ